MLINENTTIMEINNFFKQIPKELEQEIFQPLFEGNRFRIERIISKGQITPENQWYDQEEHEWVLLLKGSARLIFANQSDEIHLREGDSLLIPAHERHRVSWTDAEQETIWLAIHYT